MRQATRLHFGEQKRGAVAPERTTTSLGVLQTSQAMMVRFRKLAVWRASKLLARSNSFSSMLTV